MAVVDVLVDRSHVGGIHAHNGGAQNIGDHILDGTGALIGKAGLRIALAKTEETFVSMNLHDDGTGMGLGAIRLLQSVRDLQRDQQITHFDLCDFHFNTPFLYIVINIIIFMPYTFTLANNKPK